MTRAAAIFALLLACRAKDAATPKAGDDGGARSPLDAIATSARDLAGTWRWILETADSGTARVEDEIWQLAATGDTIAGSYVRTVDVRSLDQLPFQCNQRAWYRQRAVYAVTAKRAADGTFAIHETAYTTEPGPCDRGFRRVGDYTGKLDGGKLVLSFAGGGTQTLLKTGDAPAAPTQAWPAEPALPGAWRWDATSVDDEGNVHDETEWWELARKTATRIDATFSGAMMQPVRHRSSRSDQASTARIASVA